METVGLRSPRAWRRQADRSPVGGGGSQATQVWADATPMTLRIVVNVLLNEINADIDTRFAKRAEGPSTVRIAAIRYLSGLTTYPAGSGWFAGRSGPGRQCDASRCRLDQDFCAGSIIPVIPSLAIDADGGWLNINADTAASAVAAQLGAEKLVLLTDTPGILEDRHKKRIAADPPERQADR
ncbi:MAG: hypothetical protein U0744_06915 [Gemmataceae bacterium]